MKTEGLQDIEYRRVSPPIQQYSDLTIISLSWLDLITPVTG